MSILMASQNPTSSGFAAKLQMAAVIIFQIAIGLYLLFGINFVACVLLLALLIAFYVLACLTTSGMALVRITMGYSLVFGIVFTGMFVYIGIYLMTTVLMTPPTQPAVYLISLLPAALIISVVYAALLHPRDLHYLLFWPLMLLYTPMSLIFFCIYSIASIGDQRWGTRDGTAEEDNTLSCLPTVNLSGACCRGSCSLIPVEEETAGKDEIVQKPQGSSEIAAPNVEDMTSVPELVPEAEFWQRLGKTLLGTDVNKGTAPAELAKKLDFSRRLYLSLYLAINVLMLTLHTVTYAMITDTSLTTYQIFYILFYGVFLVSRAMFMVVGMSIHHIHTFVRLIGLRVFGDYYKVWRPSRPIRT